MAQDVYFVQSGPRGPIKIGVAADVKKRLSSLQTGNPIQLAVMATIPGGVELERELHARFGIGLIANEWFERDTPGLVETIEHILRYGNLPVHPDPDPVGWFCETCDWPMESELGERGEHECWACLKERASRYSARDLNSETSDLQGNDGV